MAFLSKVMFSDDKNQSARMAGRVGLNRQKKPTMIDPQVLKKYGGKEVNLKKEDVIFRETEEALNYFQIIDGSIKMCTDNPEGKEFIQGIFKSNDSFGEPPLFGAFPYPSTAVALEPTRIMKVTRDRFMMLHR